ncbi:hypothetical protein [Saccharopolyspora taberi]|uniref:Uncharacterized protein n=1 Tax=Saccharopolyspora taberi TaxID=60895 RepID=A0ABN3V129_9PSEU
MAETPADIINDFIRAGNAATANDWMKKMRAEIEPEFFQMFMRGQVVSSALAVVALMAELERLAPERAKAIALRLNEAWEDGEQVHTLLNHWMAEWLFGRQVGFTDQEMLLLEVDRLGAAPGRDGGL